MIRIRICDSNNVKNMLTAFEGPRSRLYPVVADKGTLRLLTIHESMELVVLVDNRAAEVSEANNNCSTLQ